jgi:oxygen-independent coproporphyrinogen-3 oxidase
MEELETIVALGSGGSTKCVYHGENRMERIENVKSVDDYITRIDEMIKRKEPIT